MGPPGRADTIIEGLDALEGPARTGFRLGQNAEYPGITDDVSDRRHASLQVFIDAWIDPVHMVRSVRVCELRILVPGAVEFDTLKSDELSLRGC